MLGAAMVTGVLAEDVVDQPWGDRCELAWCDPAPTASERAVDPFDTALERAARRAELEHGGGCLEPGAWPGDQVPASMVLDRAGRLERVRWTYPAPRRVTVLSLCRRHPTAAR